MWIMVLIVAAFIIYILYSKEYYTKHLSQNVYSEESLRKMSIEELFRLYENLSYLVVTSFDEPATKRLPIGSPTYGCKTYCDLRNLMNLVTNIYNSKRTQKKSPQKPQQETSGKITDSEKQILSKIGILDVAEKAYNNALKDHTQSMMFLGLMYFKDVKVPKKSFYWIEKAANKGDIQAKYLLGTYYVDGYGVEKTEKNRNKGISMILNAAERGNKDAINCCITKLEMTETEMRECGIKIENTMDSSMC